MIRFHAFVCGAIGVGLLVGCNSDPASPFSGLSRDKAAEMNAEHSKFENSDDPDFAADTHFAAGQLAESQSAIKPAIEQYRLALKRDNKHVKSLSRLGVLYARVHAYPEAIATWKNYVQVTRGDAAAYGNLGFCYELAGQIGEAEAAYKQGIAKDPKNQACRVNYGLLLARNGRKAEALTHLCAVLSEPEAHYNLGSAYEQQGQREAAMAEYHKAVELDAEFTAARERLARLK